MRLVISRTDSIGDVVLTIPMAGFLKQHNPDIEIYFLGSDYTKAIINKSIYIDHFLSYDELKGKQKNDQVQFLRDLHIDWFIHVFPTRELSQIVKKAGVPNRVGTSHRIFHLTTCNRLVSFSRRNSALHEAQLNFKLLAPLGFKSIPSLEEISNFYGIEILKKDIHFPEQFNPSQSKKNIILHPKSKGSAREWGLENFGELIEILDPAQFQIYVSGTNDDKKHLSGWLDRHKNQIIDITGKFSLDEFIAFIASCDALIAASTGPLHIAAAVGIQAIGIYPPIKPMHPGRWQPIGKKAHVLSLHKNCEKCRKNLDCSCMKSISPTKVEYLLKLKIN